MGSAWSSPLRPVARGQWRQRRVGSPASVPSESMMTVRQFKEWLKKVADKLAKGESGAVQPA